METTFAYDAWGKQGTVTLSGKQGTVTLSIAIADVLWQADAMVRAARIIVAAAAHHVTQRGNHGQDVFFIEDDRRFYLSVVVPE